jgi:hypothetical protein
MRPVDADVDVDGNSLSSFDRQTLIRRKMISLTLRFVLSVVAALLASLTGVCHGAIIVVGDHRIVPDGLSQVPIFIERTEGDRDLLGIELAIQIGDGTSGPTIGNVDLVTETIFESNNTGSRDKGSLPRQAFWETTTATGAVPIPESGLLATVEIDARGWTAGNFDLSLTSVLGASTVLYDDRANVVPPNNGAEIKGSVTIVPEPSGLLIGAGFGAALLRRRRRMASLTDRSSSRLGVQHGQFTCTTEQRA